MGALGEATETPERGTEREDFSGTVFMRMVVLNSSSDMSIVYLLLPILSFLLLLLQKSIKFVVFLHTRELGDTILGAGRGGLLSFSSGNGGLAYN